MKRTSSVLLNLCVMLFLCFSANLGWANSPAVVPSASHATNLLLPPLNAQGKVPVALAYRVLNLTQVNEEEQLFHSVGYVIAEWQDPRLAYIPEQPNEQYRIYQPTEIWLPILIFANSATPRSSHDIVIRVYPNGLVNYFERASAKLSTVLYLKKFPFDTQKFDIQIQPSVSQENFVELIAPTKHELSIIGQEKVFSASEDAYSILEDWSFANLKFSIVKVQGYVNEEVSRVNFEIEMKRRSEFYIFKVFLPLILMLVLAWAVFWIESTRLETQIAISMTTMLIATAFSFAIDASTPKVPYLTFIDAFFVVIYLFVFSTTIMITVIHGLLYRNFIAAGNKVQSISRIAFPALFLLVMCIMLQSYNLFV